MRTQFIFAMAVLSLGLTAILASGGALSDYHNFGGEIDQDTQFSADYVQQNPIDGLLQLAMGNTGIHWLDTFIILPLQVVAVFIGITLTPLFS